MNFREFLRLDELFDIGSADLDHIELYPVGEEDYEYDFEHDGEEYKIEIHKEDFLPANLSSDGAYSITFEGPSGLDLTGSAGMSATVIYRHLLMAIRKLMEQEEVNTLYFSPAQKRMLPMYDIFYRKYLKPDPPAGAGFVRIEPSLYTRRDFLRAQRFGGSQNLRNMLRASREVRSEIQQINDKRVLVRNLRREIAVKKAVFRHLRSGRIAMITGFDTETDFEGTPLVQGYELVGGVEPIVMGQANLQLSNEPRNIYLSEITDKPVTSAELAPFKDILRTLSVSSRGRVKVDPAAANIGVHL